MTHNRYGIFLSVVNEWAGSSLQMLTPAYELDAVDRITAGGQEEDQVSDAPRSSCPAMTVTADEM
jgi:hypothetical protein